MINFILGALAALVALVVGVTFALYKSIQQDLATKKPSMREATPGETIQFHVKHYADDAEVQFAVFAGDEPVLFHTVCITEPQAANLAELLNAAKKEPNRNAN